MKENNQHNIETIVRFLHSINIKVVEKKLPNNTFLPGLTVLGDAILMDKDQLKYPGDLLHEAGHIATTEEKMRPLIGTPEMDKNWPTDGEEITAMLWSYAASVHLNLDLKIVFHPNGYKNESDWLMEQYTSKNYIGLPLLAWMSLCDEDQFPTMKKWVR